MRALHWLRNHSFVAGVVTTLVLLLVVAPGPWIAQYGIRKTVVEDGVVLAAGYMAPAFTRDFSVYAAPVADPAPSPAPKAKRVATTKGPRR